MAMQEYLMQVDGQAPLAGSNYLRPKVFNPHQGCRCGDLPFARIHYLYTAGSRKGLAIVGTRMDMEAVIKSADSAASRKTKSRGPRSREEPRPAAVRLPSRHPGAPMQLPRRRGGCASSRLDYGFQILSCSPDAHPLRSLSGSCGIEKYHLKWRITIPGSLMRVVLILGESSLPAAKTSLMQKMTLSAPHALCQSTTCVNLNHYMYPL